MSRFRDAVRQLSSRQKSSKGVSYYSRWINRPGGRVLAAAASLTPMTPNQVSIVSGAVSAVGIALIALVPPAPWLGVVVWLVLALGFMLDSADGQLARLTGRGGAAGEWLDHVLDAAKMVGIHAAVLISWYRYANLPDERMLLVPLLFMLVVVVLFVGGTLTELLLRGSRPVADGKSPSALRSMILLVADYGVFCFTFLFLGMPGAFATIYAAFAAANLFLACLLLGKWFTELSSLPRRAASAGTGGVGGTAG
ncbi:CDP-alcohol phosphatidyltransferase family protein [Georgenia sp. SYP-B2076]|uniref:CDP-alcohol phosphatidyltransferase family protein n=1 Tax=Georgenia sp. SYP-B2076 TaxID=2495881 RepID=UPI000F8E0DAB|nr:CDP-alcohol phosphatidyltransferase family protein [Georgenia sp. SYP-B2076]